MKGMYKRCYPDSPDLEYIHTLAISRLKLYGIHTHTNTLGRPGEMGGGGEEGLERSGDSMVELQPCTVAPFVGTSPGIESNESEHCRATV